MRFIRTLRFGVALVALAAPFAFPVQAATWVPLPAPGVAPEARRFPTAVLDTRRNRIVVLNGVVQWHEFHSNHVRPVCDTWALDPVTGAYTLLAPADSGVLVAPAHAAAAYDSARDRIVLYGGATVDANLGIGLVNYSTWELDLSNPTRWRWLLNAEGNPGVAGHTMVVDPNRRRILRFGGTEGNLRPLQNQVWSFALDGPPHWTLLDPLGARPPGRWLHAAVYDAARDRMIIHGGVGTSGALGDTWALSLSGTLEWTELDAGVVPGGLTGAVYQAERDRVIALKAGTSTSAWALDLAVPRWTAIDLTPNTPVPGNCETRALVRDPLTGRIALFWSSLALDLTPLPPAAITATLDSIGYREGRTTLVWSAAADAPLYGPIEIFRRDGATSTRLGGWGPGRIEVADPDLKAGRSYGYRIQWYDGEHYVSLPEFPVESAPPAVTLDTHVDSLLARGDHLWPTWSVPDDSASMLSPLTVWRRIDTGPWRVLKTGYPESGFVRVMDYTALPESRYGYRLGWGAGDAEYFSAETTIVAPPIPTLRRGYAESDLRIVEWRYPAGLPVPPAVQRIGLPAVPAFPDAFGLVKHVDRVHTQIGLGWGVSIAWDQGGVTRSRSDHQVALPPPQLITSFSLRESGLELAFTPPPADTLTALIIERRAPEGAWGAIGSAPVPEVEGAWLDTGVEGGVQYEYRLRWTFAGIAITSSPTTFGVPGSLDLILDMVVPQRAIAAVELQASLPGAEPALLELFDVSGKRIAHRLIVGGPGRFPVALDASGISSGVYLVRATQGAHQVVKRAIVIR